MGAPAEDNAVSLACARTAALDAPGRGTLAGLGALTAAAVGTRRGFRTSFSNSDGGGPSATGLAAALFGAGAGPIERDWPHEHASEPSTLYRSHRPQATPSSISMAMLALSLSRNPGAYRHQMMLKRDFTSPKPAAPTIRKMMCLQAAGSTEP